MLLAAPSKQLASQTSTLARHQELTLFSVPCAGAVLNYSGLSSLTPAEVAASAARMLRFFDLGGHERYSKTLLHGLTAMLPDYVLLCVSAVAGGCGVVPILVCSPTVCSLCLQPQQLHQPLGWWACAACCAVLCCGVANSVCCVRCARCCCFSSGVSQATREHLAVALALGIPLLVCITKADLASEAAVAQVADDVRWAAGWQAGEHRHLK
jgi:hypothetical protein